MWPWMRDLPTSVWAGHGQAFDENGLRLLSVAAMPCKAWKFSNLWVFRWRGGTFRRKDHRSPSCSCNWNPPPSSGEQIWNTALLRNVLWNRPGCQLEHHLCLGGQLHQTGFEAAKAFRAELVEKGILHRKGGGRGQGPRAPGAGQPTAPGEVRRRRRRKREGRSLCPRRSLERRDQSECKRCRS